MGWARGADLADRVWQLVQPHLIPGREQKAARGIVEVFEEADCDTIEETEVFEVAAPVRIEDL